MSRRKQKSRSKGVVMKSGDLGRTTARDAVQAEDVVPNIGDIYESVVALLGFDPIREAEERRRLM